MIDIRSMRIQTEGLTDCPKFSPLYIKAKISEGNTKLTNQNIFKQSLILNVLRELIIGSYHN